jgi:small subunit ribosomal protein S11
MYLKLLKDKENINNIFIKYNNNNFQKKKINNKKFIFYIYITCSVRGFYINILDYKGFVLKHFTSGKLGYKKALRYNLIGLKSLLDEVRFFFNNLNLKQKNLQIFIILKGFNNRRNSFIRSLIRSLFKYKKSIVSIIDFTDLPYNGCRPKKLRRK